MKGQFLGFTFYKNSQEWKCKSTKDRKKRLYSKIQEYLKRKQAVSRPLAITFTKVNQIVRGWINYFRIADMKSIMTRIGEHLRHRLRMCIWKYWKKPKTKYKNLRKLGISDYNAYMVANTRIGYYWVANTIVLHMAISNERLKQKGLVFPLDHYLKVHTVI